MNRSVYALDTWFYNPLGAYEFEDKCEMAKELGYAGIYFTLFTDLGWKDVPRIKEVKSKYGLEVSGVYAGLPSPDDEAGIQTLVNLLENLEGCDRVEIAIVSGGSGVGNSDPAGDEAVVRVLKRLLETAERRNITIALYPHIQCWLETMDDAVRVIQKVNHSLLKTTLSIYHWYITDGKNLEVTLEKVKPYLSSVNLCGVRKTNDDARGYRETVLDDGELDNFVVLSALDRIGYEGSVGIQGFAICGDVYAKLERSLRIYKDMERRLSQHPGWGRMRPDPIPLPSGAERS
jgi:sugar phosphate isomerase/epimerase